MKPVLVILFCAMMSSSGCAPQRITLSKGPSSPEFFQFKQFAFDNELTVLTKDGSVTQLTNADITFENITWFDKKTKEAKSIPVSAIKQIKVVNRGEGAFRGMALGSATGFGTGLGLALQDGSTPYVPLSGFWEYISGPILGAGAGAGVGTGIGFLIGVRRTYDFAE